MSSTCFSSSSALSMAFLKIIVHGRTTSSSSKENGGGHISLLSSCAVESTGREEEGMVALFPALPGFGIFRFSDSTSSANWMTVSKLFYSVHLDVHSSLLFIVLISSLMNV